MTKLEIIQGINKTEMLSELNEIIKAAERRAAELADLGVYGSIEEKICDMLNDAFVVHQYITALDFDFKPILDYIRINNFANRGEEITWDVVLDWLPKIAQDDDEKYQKLLYLIFDEVRCGVRGFEWEW